MKTNAMKLCLYLVTYSVLLDVAETFQNVSISDTFDPPLLLWNSCKNRCQVPVFLTMECSCDQDCLFYGDCCRDYLYYCIEDKETSNKNMDSSFEHQLKISADQTKPRWNCVRNLETRESSEGILVVITCPPYWGIEDVRSKCEITDRHVVSEELVYDSRGYIYANEFCAICNSNITSNEAFEYNSTLCNDSPNSENCSTEFVIEDISQRAIQMRPCSLILIDTCLPDKSKDLLFGCTSFMDVYTDEYGSSFKNDICNECNVIEIWIDFPPQNPIFDEEILIPPIQHIFGFVPELTEYREVEISRCGEYEYYDATTEKCQTCENGTVVAESDYLSARNKTGVHIALALDQLTTSKVSLKESIEFDNNKEHYVGTDDGSHRNEDREKSVCIKSCNVTENSNRPSDDLITVIKNNSKLLCRILKNPIVNEKIRNDNLFAYSRVMAYVNIAVSVISLVALFASILSLICFPSQLNLAGVFRLCLMVSIFFAQFIMLTVAFVTKPEQLCIGTAVVMHYFWLALFCWSNVLAFDLTRVFGTKASRPSTSKKRRLQSLYMLYGWGLPLVIVSTCLAIHFSDRIDLHYGGESFCWFSNSNSLVLAFGIPVYISIVLNFILYIATVVGIWKVRRVTDFLVRGEERAKKRRDELKLYFKLSILMGVTWSLVFVTVYTDKPILWYIFIVLNGLQGFFIFITFTCNRQTLDKWKRLYVSHIESHSSARQLTKTTSV